MKSFQIGYLGIGPSRISGGFHLRYPISSPIHISKIQATLIGQEAITFIFHDDLENRKNTFYSQTQCIYNSSSSDFTPITSLDLNFDFNLDDDLPPSYSSSQVNNTPLSQDIIKYKIKITIFRKCNIFKLQGKNKIVSTICQIDRYSLPSIIKSQIIGGGLLMYRTESNKVKPNSKLDLVQSEALLPSEYIDMNSIIIIPLTLDLPDLNMKIEKICVVIKEYQTFKETVKEKEIVYFNESQKILDYTLLGDDIDIIKSYNQYLIELKLDIPAFDCTNKRFQAFEGVRIMKYFNVRHALKIKIMFENEGQLVLQRDIWLQRSLSEKKILKGRENGYIY
ncbi:hypothetical protein RclHR1_01600026 [Rhizophagus clarus]|nr:hypothetical protein RclHR1_01600026 [Rhizophagus clarus]